MKIVIISFIFICLFSCKQNKELPLRLINSYNEIIEKGEKNNQIWVTSPLMIAVNLSKAGEISSYTNVKLERLDKGGELTKNVEVTIKEKSYLDHEVDNSNYSFYFHLKKNNGKWRVVNPVAHK